MAGFPINSAGLVQSPKVKIKLFPNLYRGDMWIVHGIIVHQTETSTDQAVFNSYSRHPFANGPSGAHFLIDKDGTIYQTASLFKKVWHIGKLKSRCLYEHKCTMASAYMDKKTRKFFSAKKISQIEFKKNFPTRFPTNSESIGIELVGECVPLKPGQIPPNKHDKCVFEKVTDEQNASLKWLIQKLTQTLGISMTEIFRHPVVSNKTSTEASTAKWQ